MTKNNYLFEIIVIKEQKTAHAGKLITAFSKEKGKIVFLSKASRSQNSLNTNALQLFTHADVTMQILKNHFFLKECFIKNTFYELQSSLEHFFYASFILELADKLFPIQKQDPKIFDLLFFFLNTVLKKNVRITTNIAAWQLIILAGFKPELRHCLNCQKKYQKNSTFFFSHQQGGLVCNNCLQIFKKIPLDNLLLWHEAINSFFHNIVFCFSWINMPAFSVAKSTLFFSESLLTTFLNTQADIQLNSLKTINSLTFDVSDGVNN